MFNTILARNWIEIIYISYIKKDRVLNRYIILLEYVSKYNIIL